MICLNFSHCFITILEVRVTYITLNLQCFGKHCRINHLPLFCFNNEFCNLHTFSYFNIFIQSHYLLKYLLSQHEQFSTPGWHEYASIIKLLLWVKIYFTDEWYSYISSVNWYMFIFNGCVSVGWKKIVFSTDDKNKNMLNEKYGNNSRLMCLGELLHLVMWTIKICKTQCNHDNLYYIPLYESAN